MVITITTLLSITTAETIKVTARTTLTRTLKYITSNDSNNYNAIITGIFALSFKSTINNTYYTVHNSQCISNNTVQLAKFGKMENIKLRN